MKVEDSLDDSHELKTADGSQPLQTGLQSDPCESEVWRESSAVDSQTYLDLGELQKATRSVPKN